MATNTLLAPVWYCVPSKRADGGTLCEWKQRGYRVAVWRDAGDDPLPLFVDAILTGEYPGYAQAVNTLVLWVLGQDPTVQWVVSGGDDVLPDAYHTAHEIAARCTAHFKGTFGVMQPTGDGHGIESICGSPWIGREFALRVNGGTGPFWYEYHHNFVDNELQEVASRLGVFCQMKDLAHKHKNWMWDPKPVRPAFLDKAYSRPEWDKALALFTQRKQMGFPGHEEGAL